MPYFKSPYEEAEYEFSSRIYVAPFGEVTYQEADLIGELRDAGMDDEKISSILKAM